ncbi:hypothetical protein DSLASN_31740 [Desulfoluna limicola]|uniref:Uncharacterized protein n=1 Tax=Desulfoluna limicola TaxID=2810562 RepID=A0ABM7PJG7_9BACT|nr:hypothetical protein [Desulfoluna limicola]BCS97542.1 hypothetical protein DSLASN_31740 [Desulfoluna limicola]
MNDQQINKADSLVLIRMEVTDTLQIWVEESRACNHRSNSTPELFHIAFPGEIMAMSNLNASYTRAGDSGTYTGKCVRTYDASPFLDYVRTETYAASTMTHPLHHFRIVTEENIIDVITITPPQIEKISL